MTKYISYYRVSTQKQGQSKLGLEAQKTSVNIFLSDKDQLIAEYEEVESGKKNNRLKLLKAIEHCKATNSTLLIAKLDRLSRNVQFIYTLRDSNVNFVCCDLPDANTVTIGILAVLAQEERERTSQRTKKALEELRKKGVKLGTPENLTPEARKKGTLKVIQNAKENPNNKKATAMIVLLRKEKLSYRKIAAKLNEEGFKTRRDKEFSASQVLILYDRYTKSKISID
ncbi:DNA invertase Pin-like site-specific DNA recombinase [Tenacibaculum adriaticum]|uniref:DNA invertase Pin-like site-specific DNA recombinase n=1 Tax=Tenacibaculum adriaticum TaxID=413713 RepID=A0A5S5DYW0_9FLAO|nr:recombinase family protein [Tenacibaculum adriaticum]TYQ00227.1 DNA invertase Pin-like site-specific DNA recombinase [Tenacibaculum adriaticum]